MFFLPRFGNIPDETVSMGCGICVSPGVTAGLRQATSRQVTLNGVPAEVAPVKIILDELAPEPVEVALETDLPIGCGFGFSAAATLSTAFAVDHRFALGHSREQLGLMAHRAEVISLTGIGDVATQLTGGVVDRRCTDSPLDTRSLKTNQTSLMCMIFGATETKKIIGRRRFSDDFVNAGQEAIRWLKNCVSDVDLSELIHQSWRFSRQAGLLGNERLVATIDSVRSVHGEATRVLLGETVIAVASAEFDFSDWTEFRIDTKGTRLLV